MRGGNAVKTEELNGECDFFQQKEVQITHPNYCSLALSKPGQALTWNVRLMAVIENYRTIDPKHWRDCRSCYLFPVADQNGVADACEVSQRYSVVHDLKMLGYVDYCDGTI